MSALIEKIKKSRRFSSEVDGLVFSGTLPTREQFFLFGRDGLTDAELARKVVDGWDFVTEAHLLDGGSNDIVPFDKALFDEVIGDKQEWWRAIADTVIVKFNDASDKKDAPEKNSRAGSKAKV